MTHADQMTTREAAECLGKSRRTVSRMVERNEITPAARFDLGRHGTFVFDRAEVERVRALREQTPTQEQETAK